MILDPLTPDSPTLYFCLTYTGPASTALRVRQPHPPLPPLNEGRPVGTHYPGRWCSSQGFTREQAVSCVFGDLDDLGAVAVAIPGVRQRSRVQIGFHTQTESPEIASDQDAIASASLPPLVPTPLTPSI